MTFWNPWRPRLTELPLGLTGRVFASPMPFGYYDPQGHLFQEARRQEVGAIVILNDRLECLQKAGRDLEQFYVDEGLDVILGNEVEAGNFDFLCGVPGQRVALMQPERLVLDPEIARLFVERMDMPVIADDDLAHRTSRSACP